ncbi:MAG: aminotransferase class V-fold PLP-dependent enzyme [Butyrivibrio sp.]|nr:aminotransferase class V-fold PLP-dependent enzyme [Butyrivibrio sp.]
MPEFYNKLENLYNSNMYPLHMPGHKRNAEDIVLKDISKIDITEIDDFDNLHDANGIIAAAQERANKLYGADETFFLVNGSTSGVLSAISAVAGENDTILVGRNCHKSLYHAAYLRKLNLKYIYPEYLREYDLYGKIDPDTLGNMLNPSIKAVFITSPTYDGISSDIAKIADIAHKNGIPLIVDAAHGAHFGFSKELPENAIKQGADLVIHSVHKTLPSMTQTALLHVQGKLIDRDRLRRFLRIYQTSSPSYVFMASIDSCMDYLDGTNKGFFDNLIKYKEEIIQATANTRHIKVFGNDIINDAAKVVISVKNTTMTGQQLYDILREDYDLQLEMAGASYGLAIISGLDTQEGIRRLIRAIIEIDEQLSEKTDNSYDEMLYHNEVIMPIYKAWDSDYDILKLDQATGACSADFINLYPPGIPLVVPGEIITQKLIDDLKRFIKQGMNVQGVLDINGCSSVKVIVKK